MADRTTGIKKAKADTRQGSTLAQSIEEKVAELEERLGMPFGEPTKEQVADYAARWDDFVLVAEDIVVKLPLASRRYVGRMMPVKNLHTEAITIRPAGEDTIDGSAGDVTLGALGVVAYFCVAESQWIELWRYVAGGGGWVWQPTDDKTADYTCSEMFELVQVDNSGGSSITVTLPTITSDDIGKMVAVKSVASSIGAVISVQPAGGQSIRSLIGYVQLNTAWKAIVFAVASSTSWVPIYDYEEEIVG